MMSIEMEKSWQGNWSHLFWCVYVSFNILQLFSCSDSCIRWFVGNGSCCYHWCLEVRESKRERKRGSRESKEKLWRISMVCKCVKEESPGKCSCRLEMALSLLFKIIISFNFFFWSKISLNFSSSNCFGTIGNNRVRRVCLCMSMMSHHSCCSRLFDMPICLASSTFEWSPNKWLMLPFLPKMTNIAKFGVSIWFRFFWEIN